MQRLAFAASSTYASKQMPSEMILQIPIHFSV